MEEHQKGKALPLWKLVALTIPWLGVQFSWSAEFATQTSYMQSLGLSDSSSALTWVAGPITGFLVQPIVGTFSDRCTSRLGRRRPFIIAGAALTVVAQSLYAWSFVIGDQGGDRECSRPIALALALLAFWIMDCSINVIQTPLRVRRRAVLRRLAGPPRMTAHHSHRTSRPSWQTWHMRSSRSWGSHWPACGTRWAPSLASSLATCWTPCTTCACTLALPPCSLLAPAPPPASPSAKSPCHRQPPTAAHPESRRGWWETGCSLAAAAAARAVPC